MRKEEFFTYIAKSFTAARVGRPTTDQTLFTAQYLKPKFATTKMSPGLKVGAPPTWCLHELTSSVENTRREKGFIRPEGRVEVRVSLKRMVVFRYHHNHNLAGENIEPTLEVEVSGSRFLEPGQDIALPKSPTELYSLMDRYSISAEGSLALSGQRRRVTLEEAAQKKDESYPLVEVFLPHEPLDRRIETTDFEVVSFSLNDEDLGYDEDPVAPEDESSFGSGSVELPTELDNWKVIFDFTTPNSSTDLARGESNFDESIPGAPDLSVIPTHSYDLPLSDFPLKPAIDILMVQLKELREVQQANAKVFEAAGYWSS